MTCEMQVVPSPALLAGSSGKRYEFRPPWGITRRCLPGGMSLRGDPSPKGATGQAGGAMSGDQAQLPGPRGGLGAVGGAKLAQDVSHVRLDRVERHDQVVGDALV
jgi:hypothetical protein